MIAPDLNCLRASRYCSREDGPPPSDRRRSAWLCHPTGKHRVAEGAPYLVARLRNWVFALAGEHWRAGPAISDRRAEFVSEGNLRHVDWWSAGHERCERAQTFAGSRRAVQSGDRYSWGRAALAIAVLLSEVPRQTGPIRNAWLTDAVNFGLRDVCV